MQRLEQEKTYQGVSVQNKLVPVLCL